MDTPRDHEALQKLHRILHDVTGASEAPQCEKGSSIFGDVELSWRVKFKGDLADIFQNQKQFIADLKQLCGEDAVTSELTKGSIIAHITSPIANFQRVQAKANFEEADGVSLKCGGYAVVGVELGDWIMVDAEAWAQLDEESAERLRDRFDEAGLGHLLTVLLTAAPLQEARIHEAQAGAFSAQKDDGRGQYPDFGEPGAAADDAIEEALTAGATEKEVRSKALAAALKAGADEEAAASIADKRFCVARAKEEWEDGQSMINKQRPSAAKFGQALSEDLVCSITGETFVDPVKTADGMTYERVAIEHWFAAGNVTSPLTNTPLTSLVLTPDIPMKQRLEIDIYPIKLRALDSSS